MGLARALIAEIPALRRFSRALIGDVSRADSCLETMLTNVLSGTPSRFTSMANGHDASLRLNLLGSLIETLPQRLDEFDPSGTSPTGKAVQTILQRLPKRPLIAFLLRTLEDLDDEDIAYVMRISSLQARLLVELGSASIAGEISTKILIIDGDPRAASLLTSLISDLGHHLCGIAKTDGEALRIVEREQPGLIISELIFPDISGNIVMFSKLLKVKNVPLIIITSQPELWEDTINIHPAGLIPKPFLDDVVRAAISNALFFDRRSMTPYWEYAKAAQINH